MYKIKLNNYYISSWKLNGGFNPMNAFAISGDKLLTTEEHNVRLIADSRMARIFSKEEAEKFIELFGGTLIKIVEEEVAS